jgi:CubicO group peptidase (beta-lactamase class C family)
MELGLGWVASASAAAGGSSGGCGGGGVTAVSSDMVRWARQLALGEWELRSEDECFS